MISALICLTLEVAGHAPETQGALAQSTAPAISTAAKAQRPASAVTCSVDEYGYCTDKRLIVPLPPDERELHVAVNTALADVLVIWLPAGASVPKCRRPGKEEPVFCIDQGNAGAFQVEVQELEGTGRLQSKITIRPYLNEVAKAALAQRAKVNPSIMADDIIEGERGNVQFSVADRWTVNFDLVVGPAEKAVRQVLLASKEFEHAVDELGARCEERNKVERQKIQEAWSNLKARAQDETAAELAFSVLRVRRCRSARWTAFRDQLWVQAIATCEIGDHRFVVFTIRNRAGGGDIFRAGEVAVLLSSDKDPKRIEANVVFAREQDPERRLGLEDVELGKDDEVVGTVQFSAKDAPGDVVMRITEAGGKGRQVDVEDIGF